MNIPNKMIIFDLDGTLAVSKSAIDTEMADLLTQLLQTHLVAIITWGDYPQFQKQIFPFLPAQESVLKNLYVCPTCATKMYVYRNDDWIKLYSQDLSSEQTKAIVGALRDAMDHFGFTPEKVWGEIIENRGSQITFSALGQEAPIEAKSKWDPDFSKRLLMKQYLDKAISGFSIRLGGTTSIDITLEGVDKAYGIRKLQEVASISGDQMFFVGDAIFEGGNDYPVVSTGIKYAQVPDVEATKQIIRKIVG